MRLNDPATRYYKFSSRCYRLLRPWPRDGPAPGRRGGRDSGLGPGGSSFTKIAFSGSRTRSQREPIIVERLSNMAHQRGVLVIGQVEHHNLAYGVS